MVNILHNRYDVDAEWLMPHLKKHLRPGLRVCVVALSFRDERVKNESDWNGLYGPDGVYSAGIAAAFSAYGIGREQVEFISYFTDTTESARAKIERSGILYFPGGLPDKMYERIETLGLTDAIRRHDGIVMGYSAGALIQLREYHLSPDKDYPGFGYYEGLSFLDGFYVEVHYEQSAVQNEAIRRVLRERGKTVYGLPDDSAVIVSDGKIQLIGPVAVFSPEEDA